MRSHNGQMVVKLHRALISYWLNEWYYTTNHAVMATAKMVVSQGVEPHLSEEHWFTASLPSVDIYLTMAPGAGLEPATAALTVRNSTIELSRNLKSSNHNAAVSSATH